MGDWTLSRNPASPANEPISAVRVFSLIPNPKCGPFDLKNLWIDSLRRGLFARALGKLLGLKEAEEVFAAALLQDIAVPLLAKEMPEIYAVLLAQCNRPDTRLSELEREKFGWTHAEVASQMVRRWKLPEEFSTLIEKHASIDLLVEDPEAQPGELAVALSAILPSLANITWYTCAQFEEFYTKILPCNATTVSELLGQTDQQFNDFAPVLKISAPAKSLVDFYQEMTGVPS